jgi:hypothetical protein
MMLMGRERAACGFNRPDGPSTAMHNVIVVVLTVTSLSFPTSRSLVTSIIAEP